MTRRAYGSGTIERRPYKGKVGYRTRVWLADGTRRSLGVYATEAEASGVLKAAAEEIEKAGLAPQHGLSLSAFGEQWLSRREAEGKRNTRSERSCWNTHVAQERFATGPIASITPRDIRDWVRALMQRRVTHCVRTKSGTKTRKGDRTLSRETVKHALDLVRLCLEEAMVDGHIESNAARDIKAPKQAKTSDGWTYLKAEEIDAVLTSDAIPEDKRLLYQFAIYSGLREGELWGLHWADVHLDSVAPSVVVRFSYNEPTKSGKPRELLLFERAADALRRWRKISTSNRLVFPSVTGGMRHRGYDAGWRDRQDIQRGTRPGYKNRAGIARHVRFHDLRHTCASHLVSGTWGRAWRLEEVKDYLGHTNISVTQRYAHLSPDAMRAAVASTAQIETTAPSKHVHQAPPPAAASALPRHPQLGPQMVPRVPLRADGHRKRSAISLAHPGGLEPPTCGYLVYRCPYFALDVVPTDGLRVDPVQRLDHGSRTAYSGTLRNQLDVTVSNPSVTVFPANRVGRPLGVATAQGANDVPPGGSWDFETENVAPRGVDQFAFPAGALAD